ncbi:hypothetical protein RHMOL_Rhmol05G0119800 [Rhododendron molle]|uniref:Uncharacterized protein n=1 Tax=Rhododendron molle TaxID=49168 RepID=A0ACC0NN96_RHOML|nr:hypothetical protein RHMOL_Rhmol05G0119800 [Rhododendron molle]
MMGIKLRSSSWCVRLPCPNPILGHHAPLFFKPLDILSQSQPSVHPLSLSSLPSKPVTPLTLSLYLLFSRTLLFSRPLLGAEQTPWPCSPPPVLRHSSPSTATPPQYSRTLLHSITRVMAPPKKKTKGNVVDVDCHNEELKEMDEECRNEVPKHPRNAWIFFYQEQCKLKDDVSLKSMLFYLEHCTPAEYFTSRCGMRPSPRLSAWGDKDIRERACWFNKIRKRKDEKVKVIIEDGVGKRERMMNQGREVDHDNSMEND